MSTTTHDPANGATIAGEHLLGPIDQIPPGEGRAFAVEAHQVAVFRSRDGRVRAVSAVCPHQGGPIADGQTDADVVLCPLHLHAFSLDTGCSSTGAAPLRVYPVTVRDGQLVITVGDDDRAGPTVGGHRTPS